MTLDRYYLALSVLVVRLTPVKGFKIRFARLFPQCGVYKWLTAGREFEEASAGGGTSGSAAERSSAAGRR